MRRCEQYQKLLGIDVGVVISIGIEDELEFLAFRVAQIRDDPRVRVHHRVHLDDEFFA